MLRLTRDARRFPATPSVGCNMRNRACRADPTLAPVIPTSEPTMAPTMWVTRVPTDFPTEEPTIEPTALMTAYPTFVRPGRSCTCA